jgi:hypothetical protein
VLFVTRIELLERLIDAINRSIGPIGTPDFSREALILAYISQLFSSKGTILKVETKFSTIAQFFFFATVMEGRLIFDGDNLLN